MKKKKVFLTIFICALTASIATLLVIGYNLKLIKEGAGIPERGMYYLQGIFPLQVVALFVAIISIVGIVVINILAAVKRKTNATFAQSDNPRK